MCYPFVPKHGKDRAVKRREFIKLHGGAAMLPLAPRGQQPDHIRRIGVLLLAVVDDPEWQARIGAFQQALALVGWTIGRNARIDIRWPPNLTELGRHAAGLAALAPDVLLDGDNSTVGPMRQATSTVPIVFTLGVDPVGAGVVDSLARPDGNATVFARTMT
jgi:putative ABC transport system substrate-binding protein